MRAKPNNTAELCIPTFHKPYAFPSPMVLLAPTLFTLLYSFSGGPIQIKVSRFVRRCRRRRHGFASPLGAGRAGSGSDALEAFRQQLSQQTETKGNHNLDDGIEGWSVGVQMLGYVHGREEDGPILQGRVGRVEEKEDAEARQDRGWGGHCGAYGEMVRV